MADLIDQLIDGLKSDFPRYVPGTRPIHTKGSGAFGFFRSSQVARHYCRAPQFNRSYVPVSVRFSNADGWPSPDGTQQVRGMAVKFHLGDVNNGAVRFDEGFMLRSEIETDLILTSLPMFIASTPEKVLEFTKAYVPKRIRRPSVVDRMVALAKMQRIPAEPPGESSSGNAGLIDFAQRNREAQAFTVANSMLKAPKSYLRTEYHAVHAFNVENAAGVHRMVRFMFEPAEGVRNDQREELPADYLQEDLRQRLERHPVQFVLRAQIADQWDDTSDPTVTWSFNRRRINMGTLTVTDMYENRDGTEKLSFNPMRLVEGIAISDDPVLAVRREVYNRSQELRGADRCPVAAPPG